MGSTQSSSWSTDLGIKIGARAITLRTLFCSLCISLRWLFAAAAPRWHSRNGHGMKDIQGTFSKNNKCLCVKRVWPMRRRVNLTSLRIGISHHAPMTGFTECTVCYPTADSMIPARS
ncbi:hypothetical protein TNCV_4627911 [Trichonephila clavipes]|nr:hypothetical protein TNCV_4627911 [Trichonephila clavipes]